MTATTIGAGTDTLELYVSEDAYLGDAQFTVGVDGQQVGGVLTATTPHGDGLDDFVYVLGNWAVGSHTVTVNFLNDAWGGTAATDRNLYLDAVTYNNVFVSGIEQELQVSGPASFSITDNTPVLVYSTTTVGSGPDTLVLKMSQDAYQGDAQFTVAVDGQQVGDVLTASALHGSGASDTVNVLGNWATGPHTVTVSFLNDAYGGSSDTDRNLYVDGATYNGKTIDGASASLLSAGSASFGVTDLGTTVTWSSGTTEASLLDPNLKPGDGLIVGGNATVIAEGNQLAGVTVNLHGTAGDSTANLTLRDATVGRFSLVPLSGDDKASKYGHLDVYGHSTITGSIGMGEERPFGPGRLDATLHGPDSVLTLHGANLVSSSSLTIIGDQGATVENDGNIYIGGGYVTGAVNIQANLQGTGTLSGYRGVAIGNASIRLGGDVGAGQTINVTQVNLQLDQPMRFMGTLTGFDSIPGKQGQVTLAQETVAGTSFQQSSSGVGDLSVLTQDQNTGAAGATLVFHVAGTFASDAFAFTNNGTSAAITLVS